MTLFFTLSIVLVSILLSWPLSNFMTWAMEDPLQSVGFRKRMDTLFLRVSGHNSIREQNWKQYCFSMLVFNGVMFILTYMILSLQQFLPLNPDAKGALDQDLVFATIVSFGTNTNLQHYSGEASMSYFSQIFGLMWLQFVSAGTGISALVALARGLSGKVKIGSFYIDLLRSTFLILLPLAVILAVVLVISGVPMTLHGAVTAITVEGSSQILSRGPVAAFVAIKQLGTNGGGFFGPNSSHPYENPSFFTNWLECICILVIPMATVWMFGRITRRMRHAAVVFLVMTFLLLANLGLALYFESDPPAVFAGLPVQPKGNLEGKELRFGSAASPVWAAITTSTSNGSVNSMHDSLNPMTGLVSLTGMLMNVVFGGVGVGMINMFLYIIIGVFICGMMVGRTPEYLNRKVETNEMKLALLALLIHPLLILGGTAIFTMTEWGRSTVHNPGSHGFTEILYEFASAAANNGSGFEGLSDNTVYWNIATGIVMILARFIPIILPVAIAGSMAAKQYLPETAGTFPTDTPLFGIVLLGSVVFIGALLFLPVVVLGPVAEHLAARGF